MDKKEEQSLSVAIGKAVAGDKGALETVVLSVRDMVFNLSLRMLGSISDAEDAAQDILLKIITHLSSFRGESAFSTWAFRIAANYLIDYKKHMFARHPLSFEYYGEDIEHGAIRDLPDLKQNAEESVLAEELKMSCTNVLLQCLDPESRCIFVLGTMFKPDSRVAGEILEITPEAYRQRLSRIRRRVAEFLGTYCGEYGGGKCRCGDRLDYAIQNHRLDPESLNYTSARELSVQDNLRFKNAMEEIDDLSARFAFCKMYESPERTKRFFEKFMESVPLATVRDPREADA